jgi:redox-sensitive bicupin YhaK (pirin superfamily)
MEIISYVLEGELGHGDSMGTGSVIRPGEVQRMSAGSGVMHSEKNASAMPVHFLQIWILPERKGITPSYEQKAFPASERENRLRLVASHDGRDGSLTIHQDADLYTTTLRDGSVTFDFRPNRYGWLQVARGFITLNGEELRAGDGAAIEKESQVTIAGDGEALLFDLN